MQTSVDADGIDNVSRQHDPSARPQTCNCSAIFADVGTRDWSQRLGNGRGMPGVDSKDLATILDPFRSIFADLGPDRLSAT